MNSKTEESDNHWAAIALVLFLALCIWAATATAATKSDAPPTVTNGGVTCKWDDAGTTAASDLLITAPLSSRNTFAIMNDSNQKIWIGTGRNNLQDSGFPVCAGCGLSIDLGFATTGIYDGGTANGNPNLYCTTGRSGSNQSTNNDTRWIQVK